MDNSKDLSIGALFQSAKAPKFLKKGKASQFYRPYFKEKSVSGTVDRVIYLNDLESMDNLGHEINRREDPYVPEEGDKFTSPHDAYKYKSLLKRYKLNQGETIG